MEKVNANAITIIGSGAVFEGSINVPHAIRVEGTFKGKMIETSDTVTIGENGVVEADITANNAIIAGKVIGNVIIHERAELDKHASLTGDIRTKILVVNEGASFQGKSDMGSDSIAAS